MATLYELTNDFLQVQQMLEDGLDVTDTLEALKLSVEEKLEGYAKVIKNLQSDYDGLSKEVDRLNSRKSSLKVNIERMKQAMAETLEQVEPDAKGKKRVKTDKFTFYFSERESAVIEDIEKIPESFIKHEIKVDKKELTKFLKNGGEVVGASLETKKTLNIR